MWGAQKRSKTGLKNTHSKNAFKKHPLQNRTNVQIKGGGQRPFEQCSKKLHFSCVMASLTGPITSSWSNFCSIFFLNFQQYSGMRELLISSISVVVIYFGFHGDTIYPFNRSIEGTVSLRVFISSLTKFWNGRWRRPHHRQKWRPWCSPHQPPAGGIVSAWYDSRSVSWFLQWNSWGYTYIGF